MKSPPTAYVVRQALRSEAAALTALARRSKAYWGYSEDFMRSCENELTYLPEQIEGGDVTFVVAEADGAVGGFYALRRVSPLEYELEALSASVQDIGGQGLRREARTR